MPVEHYENFPVASVLLPRHLREPVEAIYVFARSADDIADEGDAGPEQRLEGLQRYRAALDEIAAGATPADPQFQRLATNIREYRLPVRLFHDLLDAFSQDVVKKRYADFPELLDYCRRSANPVGRLLLHLYGRATEENLHRSDAVCSALQLINFWQDIAVDWQKDRVYLPQASLRHFGVEESNIAGCEVTPAFRALLEYEVRRARAMMLEGAPLALALPGRIGLELRLVVQGGLRILEKIEAVGYDVFTRRPTLGKPDWIILAWRALQMKT